MYKLIITLTFALISFNSQAIQELPHYGEPVKPSFKGYEGDTLKQTGQKTKALLITCKMAKYNSSDIYSNDDLIPNLTFEIHPIGLENGRIGTKFNFGYIVIKKNGKLLNQLMPDVKDGAFGPYLYWREPNADGLIKSLGDGWLVEYNLYENNGGLYFADEENEEEDKFYKRYHLVQCNSDRSITVPIYEFLL